MNVQHTLKLYDVVNKHFMNDEDSRTFVASIEDIMEDKVYLKIGDFATKADLIATKVDLTAEISDVRLELANLATRMERGFKEQLKWTILLMISFSGIIITVIKFL